MQQLEFDFFDRYEHLVGHRDDLVQVIRFEIQETSDVNRFRLDLTFDQQITDTLRIGRFERAFLRTVELGHSRLYYNPLRDLFVVILKDGRFLIHSLEKFDG